MWTLSTVFRESSINTLDCLGNLLWTLPLLTSLSFSSMFFICTKLDKLQKMHASLVVHDLSGILLLLKDLLSLYAPTCIIHHTCAIFDLLPSRNFKSFEVMIEFYYFNKHDFDVISVYRMICFSFYPIPRDSNVICMVLTSCAETHNLLQLARVHDHIIKSPPPNILSTSESTLHAYLVDAYAMCGQLLLAQHALDEMKISERDFVS